MTTSSPSDRRSRETNACRALAAFSGGVSHSPSTSAAVLTGRPASSASRASSPRRRTPDRPLGPSTVPSTPIRTATSVAGTGHALSRWNVRTPQATVSAATPTATASPSPTVPLTTAPWNAARSASTT